MLDFHKQLKQELDEKHVLTKPSLQKPSDLLVDGYVRDLFLVIEQEGYCRELIKDIEDEVRKEF